MKPLRALIVEDNEDDALLLVEELRRGGYNPTFVRVEEAEPMQMQLATKGWDIVFSDFTMPRFTAYDALAKLHESKLDIPFIIVSGTIGEDRAVAAMKAGAHDYVLKGALKRLVPAVERELREARNRRERHQAEESAHYLAYNDPLTRLPNRAGFFQAAQSALEASLREGRVLVMLLIDLERFREVNDTLGHHCGDDLLRQVGLRLRSSVFDADVVARLGADEFGILLTQLTSVEDVEVVIRKLSGIMQASFVVEGIPVAVEASFGVAIAPTHANDVNSLLQRADVAMNHAKQTGEEYCVYLPEYDPYSPRRLALLAELRDAIEHQQLVLHYQPMIDLRTGGIAAAEALVRWQHPQQGLLIPDQFIPTTEHTGLIKPLTRWVLANALQRCCAWKNAQCPVRMNVNLSARSLQDPNLPAQVEELLRNAGVAADQLTLEITESALILEPKRAFETLTALCHIGVLISIDDFGTGYTSLQNIKKLPVHEIKIDQSFVLNMLRDKRDAAIVRSVIDLGHHLGLKVVAEGVEEEVIRDHLVAMGCDYAQGFWFSKPLTDEQFELLISKPKQRKPSP